MTTGFHKVCDMHIFMISSVIHAPRIARSLVMFARPSGKYGVSRSSESSLVFSLTWALEEAYKAAAHQVKFVKVEREDKIVRESSGTEPVALQHRRTQPSKASGDTGRLYELRKSLPQSTPP